MDSFRDALGRPLTDLRISVTDRCNFRCTYCMPRDEFAAQEFLPRSELLSFEEVTRLAELFVQRGVRKIRLTGGEPLLRKDLPRLVAQLSVLGVEVAMTTNGVLLARWASELRRAGLSRVTVSLDALDEEVFQKACDAPRFCVEDVLGGIQQARSVGLGVKVNCVVRRGVNEDQMLPLLEHFRPTHVPVRFIEFMDVGTRNEWAREQVVSRAEMLDLLGREAPLIALDRRHPEDVAEPFRLGNQEFGIISSVSAPFCGACSRARLSSDGRLFTCLFAGTGVDLRALLRRGKLDAVERLIDRTWTQRTDRYSERRHELQATATAPRRLRVLPSRVEMSFIGG